MCWGGARGAGERGSLTGLFTGALGPLLLHLLKDKLNFPRATSLPFIFHTENNLSLGKVGLNFHTKIHLSCLAFFFSLPSPLGHRSTSARGKPRLKYQRLIPDLKRCYFLAPCPSKTLIFNHTSVRHLLSPRMRKASGLCSLSILSSTEMKGGIIIQRKAPTENLKTKIKSVIQC